jgi:hypothetical protein
MFHVGYGTKKRELRIRKIAEEDKSTGVILAAVHFEWMLKRAILKMGVTPTKSLRKQLEGVYRIKKFGNRDGYKEIWSREVAPRFKKAALGTVLGKLEKIQNHAVRVRGKIIHGNGTVSDAQADEAIDLFLRAGSKLRDFAERQGIDLDTRLKSRIKPRLVD